MQVDSLGTVVEFDLIENKLFIIYLGETKISKAGCRWLSKANRK